MAPKRVALLLIWLMMLVAYVDRVVMGVAGPAITKDLGLTKIQFSYVLSAFTLGYGLLQIPGGHFADRFGARPMLVAALLIWSFFTGLTGFAAGLGMLIAIRVLFGIGEGIENGAQFKVIGDHFGRSDRSRASAFFLTAIALGPAFASPMATGLIGSVGWRGLFWFLTLPGLVVAFLLFRYLPKDRTADVEEETHMAPLRDAFGMRTWLALTGYMFFNCSFWCFIGWIPTYLKEQRHLSLSNLGLLGAVPYLCGFAGMLAMGYLGSGLLLRWRPALVSACYFFAGIGLYIALSANGTAGSIFGLSIAGLFLYGGFGPFWGAAIGLTTAENRGAFTGFVNFGGQVGGFVAPIVVGHLADKSKSFDSALLFMTACLICGGVAMAVLQMVENRAPKTAG